MDIVTLYDTLVGGSFQLLSYKIPMETPLAEVQNTWGWEIFVISDRSHTFILEFGNCTRSSHCSYGSLIGSNGSQLMHVGSADLE